MTHIFQHISQSGYASDDKERLNRGTFHAAHARFRIFVPSLAETCQTFSKQHVDLHVSLIVSAIISASDNTHGLSC